MGVAEERAHDDEIILRQVMVERTRQDQRWKSSNLRKRALEAGCRVLGEEFGEVCKAVNEREREACRVELVQVAAVAVAMIEALDAGAPMCRGE